MLQYIHIWNVKRHNTTSLTTFVQHFLSSITTISILCLLVQQLNYSTLVHQAFTSLSVFLCYNQSSSTVKNMDIKTDYLLIHFSSVVGPDLCHNIKLADWELCRTSEQRGNPSALTSLASHCLTHMSSSGKITDSSLSLKWCGTMWQDPAARALIRLSQTEWHAHTLWHLDDHFLCINVTLKIIFSSSTQTVCIWKMYMCFTSSFFVLMLHATAAKVDTTAPKLSRCQLD